MNIIVRSARNAYFVRPDTTWERDAEDFYPPEDISSISFTPTLFAHICKPGRSILEKFAPRYFDGIGFGLLLYPQDMLDGRDDSIARASCLDHTSFLTLPVDMPANESRFAATKNGILVCEGLCKVPDTAASIASAISEASEYIYLRHGDLLAIELAAPSPLVSRAEREAEIGLIFEGRTNYGFKIIF